VTDGANRSVLKNAMFLVVAQVLAMPLSLLVSAVMARRLEATEFGTLYLAGAFVMFASLFVDWGQEGALPALVATDRSRAGTFLGSGLVWRLLAAPVAYAALTLGCMVIGYDRDFQVVLLLTAAGSFFWSVSAACQQTIRGFERTDVTAYAVLGQQVLVAAIVIPTLLLGGGLRAVVIAQGVATALVAAFAWWSLRTVGRPRLSFDRGSVRGLVSRGTPFLALGLSMALQPTVDAAFLSRLGTVEAVGWHAAARKLVGVLVFPSTALMTAYYPTLCRLHEEDKEAFRQLLAKGLRISTFIVVPIAIGCALYPDIGIRLYSRRSFGPAEDNLRIMSAFIVLTYFAIMLGTGLSAAGKQRSWAATQFLCVVISAVADPLLVPWFQSHHGNGGLGVCVSTVLSEVLMVAVGLRLAPAGVVNKDMLRGLGTAAASGLAMVMCARILSGITPFVAAPLAVGAYAACLWGTGGVKGDDVAALGDVVARKLGQR
jgi:O-antigen/teichoic acid export membrane protein